MTSSGNSRKQSWQARTRGALLHFTKPKLLILDEFLLTQLVASQTADLLNVIEGRYQNGSLVICTQFPVAEWMERLCSTQGNQKRFSTGVHKAREVAIGGEISIRERLVTG